MTVKWLTGSLWEPKSVKFLQLALRGAAEGCINPCTVHWFHFCRGVQHKRLTVRSDSAPFDSSTCGILFLCETGSLCPFQHLVYTNTHSLTGISSKLLAQISRYLRKMTEKVSSNRYVRSCFVLVYFCCWASWLRYRLFSCGYLSSSLLCFQSCSNTLARLVSTLQPFCICLQVLFSVRPSRNIMEADLMSNRREPQRQSRILIK